MIRTKADLINAINAIPPGRATISRHAGSVGSSMNWSLSYRKDGLMISQPVSGTAVNALRNDKDAARFIQIGRADTISASYRVIGRTVRSA